MKKKLLLASLVFLTVSSSLMATNLREVYSCRAHLEFITDVKLTPKPAQYSAAVVNQVKRDFSAYNKEIYLNHVVPAVNSTRGQPITHADVTKYNKAIIDALKKRYSQNRVYIETLLRVSECSKTIRPSKALAPSLNDSMNKLLAYVIKKK